MKRRKKDGADEGTTEYSESRQESRVEQRIKACSQRRYEGNTEEERVFMWREKKQESV